jgi:hypothetical protein
MHEPKILSVFRGYHPRSLDATTAAAAVAMKTPTATVMVGAKKTTIN